MTADPASMVLDMLADGRLSMGHARPLIGNDQAADIAHKAVNDNLSVRQVEKLARGERPKRNPTSLSLSFTTSACPSPQSICSRAPSRLFQSGGRSSGIQCGQRIGFDQL